MASVPLPLCTGAPQGWFLWVAILATASACPRGGARSPVPTSELLNTGSGETPEHRPVDPLGWVGDAVFYELFVRSFQDSDGDGVGDLRGLVERLDYLNDGDPATDTDLGVDALWLMPIFPSPSYHGYDVVDYRTVDPEYGDLVDFASLVEEARRRGIRILLDLPLNHTSDQHPWFREAASSLDSERRGWYLWRDQDPGWRQPWGAGATWHRGGGAYYYGLFWSGMPDLNLRRAVVREELTKVMELWLSRGVAGFRIDAARYLVEGDASGQIQDTAATRQVLRGFVKELHATAPGALLVGEVWSDVATIASYLKGGGDRALPMTFNFPLAEAILDSVRRGDGRPIRRALSEVAELYPPGVPDAVFLANHDMKRVASQLGGDPARLRLAAAVLLTLPGTPFLYYGEELGMRNGPGGADEEKRTPMAWSGARNVEFSSATPWRPPAPGWEQANVALQMADAGSLHASYRRLLSLRRQQPALRRGALHLIGGQVDPLVVYLRQDAADRLLVAHNLGHTPQRIDIAPLGATGATALFASWSGAPRQARSTEVLQLPPLSSSVWRLR